MVGEDDERDADGSVEENRRERPGDPAVAVGERMDRRQHIVGEGRLHCWMSGGKRFADHATHLVIHGVLHLLGFDHVTPRKAKEMEPLETRILAGLGIADPYAEVA